MKRLKENLELSCLSESPEYSANSCELSLKTQLNVN